MSIDATRSPLVRLSAFSRGGLVAANLVGAAAFAWPFLVGSVPVGSPHQADAPLIVLGLGALLGVALFSNLGRIGLGPKLVALIAVLGAAMVALRLPGFVAGFSAMFLPVLVAGNSFGPAFGFVLGAIGTFASGLFVGGLGPWLPFQMLAVGWVGAGAGLLPRRGRLRVPVLALYGALAGFAFGAVMNLYAWPYVAGSAAIGWEPEASVATNLAHYRDYYLVTSAGWDLFRAVGNAAMILVLGNALLGVLDRAARRLDLRLSEEGIVADNRSRGKGAGRVAAAPGAQAPGG